MKNLLYLIVFALVVTPMVGFIPAVTGSAIVAVLTAPFLRTTSGLALMAIPVSEVPSLFTSKLLTVFQDDIPVKGFLRSFFRSSFSPTKFVSIAVRRGTELVAADVFRHSSGNRNKFSKSTLKKFLPPFYWEFLDVSDHELYDTMIMALAEGNTTFFAQMTVQMAKDFVELRKKIDRAIEFQCSQIFETGIITLNSGDNIDFKRKPQSIVAYNAANDFGIGTVDPSEVILVGCNFLRQTGKVSGGVFTLILGETSMQDLLNNPIIQARNDIKNFDLDQIFAPNLMPDGMASHGVLSCGSYRVRLFTYPESFETSPGTSVKYINDKKIILLPTAPIGELAFAAVPQLIRDGRIPQTGEFLTQEEFKEIEGLHRLHLKSAAVAVPVKIDQMWTLQTVV